VTIDVADYAEDECAIVADALLADLVAKRWSIEYGGM
jgi:hypothetical protein